MEKPKRNGRVRPLRTRLPEDEAGEGRVTRSNGRGGRPPEGDLTLPIWAGRGGVTRDEAIERVVETLQKGLGYATAAARAGIEEQTLLEWRQKDKDLARRLEQVRAEAAFTVASKLMGLIEGGDLKAIERWLRTRTHEFQDRATLQVDAGYDPDESFL